MADNVQILPNYANTEGANTAVLPEGNILDNYWRSAENQYRKKLFNYQQQKDETQRRLSEIDFNTAGTWERDLPFVNDKLSGAIDYIDKNPAAIEPSRENMTDYLTHKKQFNDLDYFVNKSKLDKANYDVNKAMIVKTPYLQSHAADYIKQLDDWAQQPVDKRGEFQFNILPDDNPIADALLMDNAAIMKDEQVGTPENIGSGMIKIPKTTDVDMTGAEQVAKYKWDSNPNLHPLYQEHWDALSDEQKQKYPTPYDYFVGVRKSMMKTQPKTVNEIRNRPDSDGSGTTKPKLTVDYQSGGTDVSAGSNIDYTVVKRETKDYAGNPQTVYVVKDSNGNLVKGKDKDGNDTTTFDTPQSANDVANKGQIVGFSAIGGWDLSKTGNAPANILITPPTEAYDPVNNKHMNQQDVGANSWNVDVLSVKDYYVNKKTGAIKPAENVNNSNRDQYDVKRLAKVNRTFDSKSGMVNKTYFIPYSENVQNSLENSGVKFNNELQSQPKEQRTVVKTGMYNGKKVIQYSDGTVEYAN